MAGRPTGRWDVDEHAYLPRPLICHRLSGMDGEDQSWLDTDIDAIKAALEVVSDERSVEWDPFIARDEVPLPRDGADTPELRSELNRKNSTACDRGDCLVIHAYRNGSTYLGLMQDRFLNGPIVRPVLVLRHRRSDAFSRAWAGLAQEHPNLTIETFDDSNLMQVALDWFRGKADTIEASAAARRALDARWRPVCDALVAALRTEPASDLDGVARAFNRTPSALYDLISRPIALARIGAEQLFLLQQRYGLEIESALALSAARELLSEPELAAWRAYAETVGQSRARVTLVYEVRQRETTGIFKNRPRLVTVEAWSAIERSIKRG